MFLPHPAPVPLPHNPQVLDMAGKMVALGVTTDEIDKAVHKMIIEAGAYPSPLNYGRFPKSVCTSVNECICHGIPDSRALREGDIINIDVTVYLDVRGERGEGSREKWVVGGPPPLDMGQEARGQVTAPDAM